MRRIRTWWYIQISVCDGEQLLALYYCTVTRKLCVLSVNDILDKTLLISQWRNALFLILILIYWLLHSRRTVCKTVWWWIKYTQLKPVARSISIYMSAEHRLQTKLIFSVCGLWPHDSHHARHSRLSSDDDRCPLKNRIKWARFI